MLHWAAYSPKPGPANGSKPVPQRYDSLNATQTRSTSDVPPMFLNIEEELHDARRVHAHGQEDDLRSALSMVINRVGELSTLLQGALKSQAELETQLGIAKANLQLVIANNEMLEDALKQYSNSRDVGWNRGSKGRQSTDDSSSPVTPASNAASPTVNTPSSMPPLSPLPPSAPPQQDSRFFKFRFNNSTSSSSSSSRPGTPTHGQSPSISSSSRGLGIQHHLTSPSMPSLPMSHPDPDREQEIAQLTAKLEEERKAHKHACDEKAALEAEIESLSAALFEEANKMVAVERIKLHETTEELKEAKMEKEALKSALRLIEGENSHLRQNSNSSQVVARSRSSSIAGVKSPANSSPSSSPPRSESSLQPHEGEASTSTPGASHRVLPVQAGPRPSSLTPDFDPDPPSLTSSSSIDSIGGSSGFATPSEDTIPVSSSSFSTVALSPAPSRAEDVTQEEAKVAVRRSEETTPLPRPAVALPSPSEAEASPWADHPSAHQAGRAS